jgi:glutamate formiminotransferase/formiminotetrahydrofolate cyclodeaminase
MGNVNAISDAGVAGLLAAAGAEGAMFNVQINLKSLPGNADKDSIQEGLQRLHATLGPATQRLREAVRAILNA